MTAEPRLDAMGPHVRVVVWRDGERRRTADVTYRSTNTPCARVYGAPTLLPERVHRAVARRAGRFPASVQWFELHDVGGGLAAGRSADEQHAQHEVPASLDTLDPEAIVAMLLALAERVEAEGVEACAVRRSRDGDSVDVALRW